MVWVRNLSPMDSGKLKPGWARVAFGEVVRQVKDQIDPVTTGLERYVAGEHMGTDDLRIRRWGIVGDGYLGPAFRMRFRSGHVLYGSRRTYLRKVAVADFEGITANTTFVIETKDPNRLLPELLPFIMQTDSFHKHSISKSKGSVNPYVNFSDLTSYEFALPPVHEQRRIATALTATTQLAEKCRSLADCLTRAKLSAVEHTVRGTPHSLVPVADLLREPPRNGISPVTNAGGIGLKTVSVSAVDLGVFDPTGCVKRAQINIEKVQPFFVQRDDVFVVRGNGNRSLCGKAGLSQQSYEDLFYPDLLIRLRFDKSRILPSFAADQWNLPSVHRRLSARAKSTNGTWKINGQDIRAHELAVPSLDQQRSVLHSLGQLRNGVDSLNRFVAAILRLRSTLLSPLGPPNLP